MQSSGTHQRSILVHLHRRLDPDQSFAAVGARRLADQALNRSNPTFCMVYPEAGRPSIPSDQLLLPLWLQEIHSIRSERMLIEQLVYYLLFR